MNLQDITLTTKCRVSAVNRKSSAECFRDLEVGDVIQFEVDLSPSGRTRRGLYAKYVRCVNMRTSGASSYSFNELARILECCELEEVATSAE